MTASCPVPIVMAGGTKLPVLDALTMAYRALEQGAACVDMGRNIGDSRQDAPRVRRRHARGPARALCTPSTEAVSDLN